MLKIFSSLFFFVLLAAAPAGVPEVKVISKGELSKYSHVITQKDKSFDVEKLEIKVGESVVFVNGDLIVHNVFSRTETNDFNLKVQAPDSVNVVTFHRAGEVKVFCAIHPRMKMTIIVKE
jgi:plastocyanin